MTSATPAQVREVLSCPSPIVENSWAPPRLSPRRRSLSPTRLAPRARGLRSPPLPTPTANPRARRPTNSPCSTGSARPSWCAKKQVTPLELVEAAIARVEKLDPTLNSVVTRTFEQARKRAGEPMRTGPFAGVPFLIKDLENLKGVRLTYWLDVLQEQRRGQHLGSDRADGEGGPGRDRQIEHARVRPGASHRGPRLRPHENPWNLDHSPGGSSGGAAAAVAAGLVPLAQASDGGGSIRIPANCCGLFGLKINRGRNPEGAGRERRRTVGRPLRQPLGAR